MADGAVLVLLERLARIVGAMAQDTPMHDQVFDLLADIQGAPAMTETTPSPHCGRPILSPRAQASLNVAKRDAPSRGGYMWEGARPAFEAGEYRDDELSEMLAAGAIEPHPDPAKGYVVKW